MFNKNQIEVLNKELNSNRIKTREKGNINLSYLEGFDIIETANTIFGFGNWDYAISKLEFISSEMNQNQNHVICYKAIVQVLVHSDDHSKDISREDVGFGSGVAKTLADAHENAGKEAVTDALKRAMRSFGNQFGNSLYDKTRNHNSSTNVSSHQESSYQQNQQQKPNYNQNNSTNTNFKGVGNQQQTARQNQTQTIQQQVQNQNSRNVNQNPNNQHNNPQQHSFQNNQTFDQYEYQGLYNLGLDVIEQNGFLVVTGNNQYAYKDAIKACGFRFDSASKTWYKPVEQGVA
ncbi:MAG: Rad52/Rad22 family DNA repair protein [Candidatus Altimarinota bacterium]